MGEEADRAQHPPHRSSEGAAEKAQGAGEIIMLSAPARLRFALLLLVAAAAMQMLSASGCSLQTPPNVDWSAPATGDANTLDEGIQQALDTYAGSLVSKGRDEFLSVIDTGDQAFAAQQLTMFDRLAAVPFADYRIDITSLNESSPGNVIAKVDTAYTYSGSFSGLPDPERAAFSLVETDAGWKISGDATEQALGKPRGAGLEDFGPVRVLTGDHVLVFSHDVEEATAAQAARLADDAFPRLETSLPGVNLPKVPIRVFDGKEQIDAAFPGKWTEWAGGASRQLGAGVDQGGEIIIDADLFTEEAAADSGYNPKMMAHELTHVALFPQSGPRVPPFLIEGLADYVAGEDDLALLQDTIRRGESFSPSLKDLYQPGGFAALLTPEAAILAYEQADAAVALLEERYGPGTSLQLIREFKRRGEEQTDQELLVDEVFHSVLGIGWDEFETQWRDYVAGS
jgi:hypothetical protein